MQVAVVTLNPNFRIAACLVRAPLPAAVPAGHLLVRRVYAGVNASDINYSSGRYARVFVRDVISGGGRR